MVLKEIAGALVYVFFLAVFVLMMNTMTAPNATFELGNLVIVVDLLIIFVGLMLAWGPLVNGEPWEDVMPVRLPSWVGIPLGVALFVFLYVSGLGEILLHANEVASPAIALTVAAAILLGATYLSTRPDPTPSGVSTAQTIDDDARA